MKVNAKVLFLSGVLIVSSLFNGNGYASPKQNSGIGYLNPKSVSEITVLDDSFKNGTDKAQLIDFLNNIKVKPIIGKNKAESLAKAKAEAPTGGVSLNAKINFQNGDKVKTEVISLFDADYLVITSYDKVGKKISSNYYRPQYQLADKFLALCDNLSGDKLFCEDIDIDNIVADGVESASVGNFVFGIRKKLTNTDQIKEVLDILKQTNPHKSSIKDSSACTMKILLSMKSGYEYDKMDFFFTENLLKYKAYDSKGELITMGYYTFDNSILKKIDILVHQA